MGRHHLPAVVDDEPGLRSLVGQSADVDWDREHAGTTRAAIEPDHDLPAPPPWFRG
ncbi:hypothetical protein [Mycobacteroides immunogenum]|uniref:hypothetical protein n=1 Tax=Mycobacteroides immunogenum TaxID=83262 RepID=UPI0013F4E4BE|nr:hypothetical protein [Mycobacteroides immunogenum]